MSIEYLLQEVFSLTRLFDISLVLIIAGLFIYFLTSSRLYSLIKIIGLVFSLYFISEYFHFTLLNRILNQYALLFFLLIIVLFQVELRHSFETMRRGKFWSMFASQSTHNYPALIKQILNSIDELSRQRIGALIAIEGKSPLSQYCDSGVLVNGRCSAELLQSLFWPGTPTHDGAVVIRNDSIVAAACLLPLSEHTQSDQRIGTRHMAAIGLSEKSDALVIVVSEETGDISIAENGNLTRFLNRESIETRLFNLYQEPEQK